MDQLDRVRLLAPLRDLHARRTKRHPWEDQAACVRLFFEETLDVRGRNVAFDDVYADLGRVARALYIGDTQPLLDRTAVITVVHIHSSARLLTVVDPGIAAPAGRALVDGTASNGSCRT